jgi:DNA uptake protein ComE-like DNA-binding protein
MTILLNRAAASRRAVAVIALTLVLLCGLPPAVGLTGAAMAAPAQVDLNSAPLEAILALPVPAELAQRIYDYRVYQRYYKNVFQLMEVGGMTAELLETLKPLVSTRPPTAVDASLARLSASFRQVQNFLSEEGASEGLADEYLDRLRNPEDINDLDLYDLMSYQNVSPVDATAIVRARQQLGRLEGERQLRGVDGLRYFSYRGLRDFVVYDPKQVASTELTGYYQTRFWQTPFVSEDDEAMNAPQSLPPQAQPGWLNKVRLNHISGVQAGLLTTQEYGEQNWNETTKAYVGITNRRSGNFRLKSLMFGNFRVAYGLGLVMDNTDYIKYRKTGYGFDTRPLGVYGDLSRSFEFDLTGVAAEGSWGPVQLSLFAAGGEKDGILNPDGTINRYIIMRPRPQPEQLDGRSFSGLRRDAFREDMLGGNLKVMLKPGTFLGVTGYEARYDRGFRADESELVLDTSLLDARDSEIWNAYTSVFTDANGETQTFKYRRVLGAEAQTVFANVALQGEYAFLQDPRNSVFNSKNPDAYVVNAFSQWDNLHLLAIYRDYDIGFDNPYSRAFSNDSRYEMTILDSYYRLDDPLYYWLESNTPQPKAEKGLFLDLRYRISRALTITGLQYDQWTRKADGADLMRYTIKGEYQPVFNLRFRVRHRYSSRSEMDPVDVRKFKNWETRWQAIALLSDNNRLGFMYMTSNVMFPPRARLGGTAVPGAGDPSVGTAGSPGTAFEVRYEHNLAEGLRISFASSVYDGFLWNFEGNEFVLLDGQAFRNWVQVESRVSDRLLCQLKVTRDHNLPKEIDVREFGDPYGNDPDATRVPGNDTIVRLQMDYTF